MIKIPKAIIEMIKRQAGEEAPLEACGYLAGVDQVVEGLFPMTNIDQSPEHFSFDPKEQLKVIKSARAKGWELAAVYHSHPASAARLSQEDIRLAHDPDIVYLIYSIPENKLSAFKLVAGKVISEEIRVGV